MTSNELDALMTKAGLEGLAGAVELAQRIGTTWRTVYRWRSGERPISGPTEKDILGALVPDTARTRRRVQIASKR